MPWLKLDDRAPEHPKWMELADDPGLWAACWGLWVCCLTYCGRNLTDGRIPRAVALQSTPLPRELAGQAAAALVRVGLWEVREDGAYQVHDYLEFNPSAEEVHGKRAANAARVQASRDRKASRNAGGNALPPRDVTLSVMAVCNSPEPEPLNKLPPAGAPVRAHMDADAVVAPAIEPESEGPHLAIVTTENVAPEPPRRTAGAIAHDLAREHDRLGREVTEKHPAHSWKPAGLRGPSDWLAALEDEAARYDPSLPKDERLAQAGEELHHQLAMAAAEADALAAEGAENPLGYLRAIATSRYVRAKVSGLPDAATAARQARASPAARQAKGARGIKREGARTARQEDYETRTLPV